MVSQLEGRQGTIVTPDEINCEIPQGVESPDNLPSFAFKEPQEPKRGIVFFIFHILAEQNSKKSCYLL